MLEVLLRGSTTVGGCTTAQLHQAVLTTYTLSSGSAIGSLSFATTCASSGACLLERHGRRYAYRLTAKGLKSTILFTLFHQRICGP